MNALVVGRQARRAPEALTEDTGSEAFSPTSPLQQEMNRRYGTWVGVYIDADGGGLISVHFRVRVRPSREPLNY